MKPIIKRFAVVSSVAAASVGSLFVQTLTNAGSLPNSENGFSSDSTIKTVYTETVDTADNKVVDIFDNKAIAITGLDVYASAEEGAEVVGNAFFVFRYCFCSADFHLRPHFLRCYHRHIMSLSAL